MPIRLFHFWRLLILLAALFPLFGQQDILISERGPYRDMLRGGKFGASGQGGVNNAFIVTPTNTDQGFCIFLSNNNPSQNHDISLSVFQSGDRQQLTYTGATEKWSVDPLTVAVTNLPHSAVTVSYDRTNAAARVAFVIADTISGTA